MELSSTPLWFEFKDGDLVPLASPALGHLNDFVPWALAPHVTGIAPLDGDAADGAASVFDGGLGFAVNGIGFFAVFPWEANEVPSEPENSNNHFFAVKKIPGGEDFAGFTGSEPFMFNGHPSILMVNIDFFSERPVTLPDARVYTLIPGAESLFPVAIPAFSAFPPRENWEIKDFFISREGRAWFSALKNDKNAPKLLYCSTDSSLCEAEYRIISLGEFRRAGRGMAFREAPPLLKAVFDRMAAETAGVAAGKTMTARVYSYDAGAYTAWFQEGGEEVEEFFGVWAEKPAPFAALCNGAGQLVYGTSKNADNKNNDKNDHGARNDTVRLEQLAPLPEGFVWTALSFCDGALAAAWEEREQWNIGASGLAFWYIDDND